METLSYWLSRLEPLIRAEDEEEIIVVLANRTGVEDDAVYAGTSAVIGIQDGEVSVYGILGRGEKELLVVDTSLPPTAKIVSQHARSTVADKNSQLEEPLSPSSPVSPVLPTSPAAFFSYNNKSPVIDTSIAKNDLSVCIDEQEILSPSPFSPRTHRPSSPKSRNVSRTRAANICEPPVFRVANGPIQHPVFKDAEVVAIDRQLSPRNWSPRQLQISPRPKSSIW